MTTLLVAVAGATGAVVRFLMEYAVRRRHPTQRPWATVAANVLGTGIAGFVAYHFVIILGPAGVSFHSPGDTQARSILLTGFCGGFTTFSSAFAIPAILNREHHWKYAVTLVLVTPVACAAAFLVGMSLAH